MNAIDSQLLETVYIYISIFEASSLVFFPSFYRNDSEGSMRFNTLTTIICLFVLHGLRMTLAYECITAGNSAIVQDIMEAAAALRQMGKKICPQPSKLLRRAWAADCTIILDYRTVQITTCGPRSASITCQDLAQEVDNLRVRCLKFSGGTFRARGSHYVGELRVELGAAPP